MREQYLYPKVMFEVDVNGYCGVFMPTEVMKKIEKENMLFQKKVQSILTENKDNLLVLNWTLANTYNDDGSINKQQIVKYSDINNKCDSIEKRINLFKPMQPKKVDVYICDRDIAVKIAEEILQEKNGGEKNG